jgi:maltose-binding protein MalE
LFEKNKAAMLITGFWDIGACIQAKDNFGIAPLPLGPKGGGMETVGTGLAVAAQSKYPAVAFDVIKFLETKAGQAPIVTNGEDVPATKAGMNLWIKSLPKGVSFDTLQNTQNEVFSPHIPPQWNQLQDGLGNDLAPFFNGKQSLAAVVQKASSDIDNLISGN